MKEIGEIIELEGNQAIVRIQRSSACGKCGACKFGASRDGMLLSTYNHLNGKPGDFVEIELESSSIVKASIIVYLIPLLGLIIGVVVGYFLAGFFNLDSGLLGAIGGILFTALTFLGIKAIDPLLKEKDTYSPKMVSIINQNNIP